MKRLICKLFGHKWHCIGQWTNCSERTHQPISSTSCWVCFRCRKQKQEQWDW